jgi:hypothetical protein
MWGSTTYKDIYLQQKDNITLHNVFIILYPILYIIIYQYLTYIILNYII